MTADEILRRLQNVAQKARSNASEIGYLEISESLDPIAYGTEPLSILTMTEVMLAKPRGPAPIDVMNVLVMAHCSPTMVMMYGILWEEDLPEAMPTYARLMGGVLR